MKYKYHKDHTEPQNGEVFVFGSNLAARHGGGAAKLAEQKYGASRSINEGMSGNSYAIPTKDESIETLSLKIINWYVKSFMDYAEDNPEKQFFMTRVGCVLAGYNNSDIAPLFRGAPTNINFPEEWKEYLE